MTVEWFEDGSSWPRRDAMNVRDMKQARAERVRFAFVNDVELYRVWVAKYVFGNTTEAEREIPMVLWTRASYNVGMPGWAYKEVYLVGKDRP